MNDTEYMDEVDANNERIRKQLMFLMPSQRTEIALGLPPSTIRREFTAMLAEAGFQPPSRNANDIALEYFNAIVTDQEGDIKALETITDHVFLQMFHFWRGITLSKIDPEVPLPCDTFEYEPCMTMRFDVVGYEFKFKARLTENENGTEQFQLEVEVDNEPEWTTTSRMKKCQLM